MSALLPLRLCLLIVRNLYYTSLTVSLDVYVKDFRLFKIRVIAFDYDRHVLLYANEFLSIYCTDTADDLYTSCVLIGQCKLPIIGQRGSVIDCLFGHI